MTVTPGRVRRRRRPGRSAASTPLTAPTRGRRPRQHPAPPQTPPPRRCRQTPPGWPPPRPAHQGAQPEQRRRHLISDACPQQEASRGSPLPRIALPAPSSAPHLQLLFKRALLLLADRPRCLLDHHAPLGRLYAGLALVYRPGQHINALRGRRAAGAGGHGGAISRAGCTHWRQGQRLSPAPSNPPNGGAWRCILQPQLPRRPQAAPLPPPRPAQARERHHPAPPPAPPPMPPTCVLSSTDVVST